MGKGRGCERYGEKYWCVKVPESISSDGEIYVFADRIELVDGALVCIGHFNVREGDKEQIYLALGPGQWLAFYAASVLDGSAVAIEHWAGEVVE